MDPFKAAGLAATSITLLDIKPPTDDTTDKQAIQDVLTRALELFEAGDPMRQEIQAAIKAVEDPSFLMVTLCVLIPMLGEMEGMVKKAIDQIKVDTEFLELVKDLEV